MVKVEKDKVSIREQVVVTDDVAVNANKVSGDAKQDLKLSGFGGESGEPWLSGEHFVLEAESAVEPGQMEIWQQVEDFDLSAPWDKHYTLKEGILRFGDCIHGLSQEAEQMG